MPNGRLRINDMSSFTIIESVSGRRDTDKLLRAGTNCHSKFYSFLYFDTSGISRDITINSATLRIYVKKAETCGKSAILYVYPLSSDWDSPEPIQSSCCSNDPISIKLNDDFHGWLDINIFNIVEYWHNHPANNYGLLIDMGEQAPALVTFCGEESSAASMEPHLILNISYYPIPAKSDIRILELSWHFHFCKSKLSPPINTSKIKQGSFFITNNKCGILTATVETGSDLLHWVKDSQVEISPCSTSILIAKYYGKFYRIRFTAESHSDADIRFIGQFYT